MPPVEPPQPTEAMPVFGYDNSEDVNHWLEQTRDYIIWQLRLSKFHYFRLNRPRTQKMSKKELIFYLFQKRGIKPEIPQTDDEMDKLTQQFKNLRIPQTDGMDRLTQQFKNLNIGHAGRIPQMHPSSRVYESAAAQFAYPQVPKKQEDLNPLEKTRGRRRRRTNEPRRRSRSPGNLKG
jgi:hypothetical protein